MADVREFDIIIIGGGPGGYVAAIRAAQLGKNVALIESEHLGGICLNWGCIPTKALLRSAEIYHQLQHLDEFGLSADNPSFDFEKIINRSRKVAKQLSGGIAHLLKKNKITVIDGYARLLGDKKIEVSKDGENIGEFTAPHIILATGARARDLPNIEVDGKLIWNYKNAMVADALPKSLLVIGSGAIGMEFACFYNRLGVDVTIIELADEILPNEDKEISALAYKSFVAAGMKFHRGVSVDKIEKSVDNVVAHFGDEKFSFDRVISAVGIVGNVEDIGLEHTKAEADRGHIVVDEWSKTGEEGLYAIGDVAAPPWLAHKASHEGVICVEKIFDIDDIHPLKNTAIPACTYTSPQIASIGLTEEAAIEAGKEIKVGRFPYVGNGKALAMGETEGLVKTIFDANTGELLGAHMIGAEVTELIEGYAVAMKLETTESELIHTIFPHPTLSEMMHESVLDAFGKAIHF